MCTEWIISIANGGKDNTKETTWKVKEKVDRLCGEIYRKPGNYEVEDQARNRKS